MEITDDAELFKCKYCGNIILIRRKVHTVTESQSPESGRQIEAQSEMIVPVVKKSAGYWVSKVITHGGHLILTETDVVFIPHQFNFVKVYRVVLPISGIVRVWKSGLNNLNIGTRDAKLNRFVIWGRDEFIHQLERRMRR